MPNLKMITRIKHCFNFTLHLSGFKRSLLNNLKLFLFFPALLSVVGWGPFSYFFPTNNEPIGTRAWLETELSIINSQAGNFNPAVVRLSLMAYAKAYNSGYPAKPILTVIDYSKPSTERRLLVVDLHRHKVLFNTYVSHGKNSGKMQATSFSNQPGSLKSSLGVFLTENSYVGSNGYSLRLVGLEHGVNDNAYRRAIVVHGAWYVNSDVIRKYGQLGRSWGCPAVSDNLARPLIDTIKGRSLVFVYSNNDRGWLRHSSFLTG
jgi:hypothetical protein